MTTDVRREQSAFLRPGELAHLLNVSTSTIYTWKHEGKLPVQPVKFGRALRFRRIDVEELIAGKVSEAMGEAE